MCLLLVVGGWLGSRALAARAEHPAVPTSVLYDSWMDSPSPGPTAPAPSPPSVLDQAVETPPAPVPAPAMPVSFAIPAIGVDAPVVTLGIGPDGNMQSPSSPDDVAWYNFSSQPGEAGNAVFSGHVDWATVGPAVFWDLGQLTQGDTIVVNLADGTSLTYSIVSTESYDVETIPMETVLERTEQPSITVITCDGSFENGEYSHRLVVRAVQTAES